MLMKRFLRKSILLIGIHFLNNPAQVKVGVTNVETGQCEYLDGKQLDEKCTMLKATCAIPFAFPVISLKW